MAWDTPKSSSSSRTTVFPNKLKSFVRDVASLKRTASGHARTKSVASIATESEQAWSIASDFDCPEEQPERKAGISVQLSLSFEDLLEFSCNRCYNSSTDFKPTERLLRGLLRRIDHGSFELITRKDPNATIATKGDGKPKTKRFEMIFRISQEGSLWATRTYRSYQRDAMSASSVKEVVLSSHRLVGLFLRRHDPDFVWRDGPICDDLPEGPETSPYRVGVLQPMSCIPRSRFLEKTQTFEAIPGFKIEFSITSRSQRRKPPEWQKTITVESNQSTPLNLAVAEALFSNASYALEAALRLKRKTVEERHRQSCGFISSSCQHFDEDAAAINLRVSNNLGPQFDHLHRTITSKLVLLNYIDSKESVDFFNNIENALSDARDAADHTIDKTNDLEFRVVELRGRGWNIDEPLVFTLGPTDSYSRRSIQAILDRVQAGVADVLRGNAATVRMSAAKRGHYILDKTLLAPRDPSADTNRWSIPSKNKTKVVDKLRRRIHQDIDMICKDTCSLDNLDDNEPATIRHLPSKVDVFGQSEYEATNIPIPLTPSPKPAAFLEQAAEIHASSPVHDEEQRLQTAISEPEMTGVISESPSRPRPKHFTYLKSGARAFPLVPKSSSYSEASSPSAAKQNFNSPLRRASDGGASTKSETHGLVATKGDTKSNLIAPEAVISPDTLEGQSSKGDAATKAQQNKIHTNGTPELEERRASISTLDQRKQPDAEELSLAPSTPSLAFTGGHSARSSVHVFTPQIHGHGLGPDFDVVLPSGASGSRHYDQNTIDASEIESHEKVPQAFPADLLSSKFPASLKHKPIPSPLHKEGRPSDEDVPGVLDTSKNKSSYPGSNGEIVKDPSNQVVSTIPDPVDGESHVTNDNSGNESSLEQGTGEDAVELKSSTEISELEPQASAPGGNASQDGSDAATEPRDSTISVKDHGEAFAQGEPNLEPSHEEKIFEHFPGEAPIQEGSPTNKLEEAESTPEASMPETSECKEADEADETPNGTSDSHLLGATPEQAVVIPVKVTSADGVRTPTEHMFYDIRTPSEGFAQTRQELDFDFSSPWSAASPYSEISQPALYANLDNAIDDEPEDSRSSTNKLLIPRPPSSSLVRPLFSRTRHRSFGSAGLLGFRVGEPRLIEVGLRRALMIPMIRGLGDRPMTAMSFWNDIGHRGRAALLRNRQNISGRELELTRRPASTHGREGSLEDANFDGVVMKRSASSGLLQDMVVVEAKGSQDKDGEKTDAQGKGKGKSRSGSLMFLIAGATLAAQMLGANK